MPRKYRQWTDEDLIQAVSESISFAQVIRQLDLAVTGGTYKNIQKHIQRLNLDTSHFATKWGTNRFGKDKSMTLDDILTLNKDYESHRIKSILLRERLKINKCEMCGIDSWLGQTLSCQLHHINGVRFDHRLENLQMLCPNCHSLTDNYGGKNKRPA